MQVFSNSIIDKVSSEEGAHLSDAKRKGHHKTTLETRDFANSWQCLPDKVFNSTDVNKNDTLAPWLKRSKAIGNFHPGSLSPLRFLSSNKRKSRLHITTGEVCNEKTGSAAADVLRVMYGRRMSASDDDLECGSQQIKKPTWMINETGQVKMFWSQSH